VPRELDWLESDINQYLTLIKEHRQVFTVLGDHTDPDQHNYYDLIVDQFFRAHQHAMGMHALMSKRLRDPTFAVARAFLESAVNLCYLANTKKPIEAAVVLRAYWYIKETRLFGRQKDLVQDRAAILRRMPQHLVRLARHRAKTHEPWAGVSFRRMAAKAKLKGPQLHAYLSEEAHGRAVGRHVWLTETTNSKARLNLGASLSASETDATANFVRRVLNSAFRAMWTVLDGPKVVLQGRDPHVWAAENERGGRP